MTFDWWTFGLQAVNFLVLAWLLQRLLYKPVLAALARRKAEVQEIRARAETAEGKAEATQRGLEQELAAIPREREQALERLHAELAEERERRTAAAAEEAEALLAQARADLAAERERALADLRLEVTNLAGALAERLLRGARSPLVTEGLLERLDAHLTELDADALRALDARLQEHGGELEVAVAPPLDAEAQERWRRRLAAHFDGAQVIFTDEDDLIAGAELRLPEARLRFSLRSILDEGLEELRRDRAS